MDSPEFVKQHKKCDKASKKLLKHQLILDEYKDPCSDDGIYYDARAQQQAQEAITELLLSLDCVTHKYDELIARHATVTETDGHKSLQLFRRKTFCHRMQASTDSKLCAHDSTGVTYPMPWTLQEATLYKDWTSLKGLTGNFACLQSRTMSVADMNRQRHVRDKHRSRRDKVYYICGMQNCTEPICRFEVSLMFHYKTSKYY